MDIVTSQKEKGEAAGLPSSIEKNCIARGVRHNTRKSVGIRSLEEGERKLGT